MLSHHIQNTNTLCTILRDLLDDDIVYLKSHPNPKYYWGNHSSNIASKFYQFDELISLPMFDRLLMSGINIDKIFLYYIKPHTTKILYNTDAVTRKLSTTSIIIPLDRTPSTNYIWYNPEYVDDRHKMKDFSGLYKTHGIKMIAKSQGFNNETPLLIQHDNIWSGIVNNNNPNEFTFLELTFKNNPTYDKVKSIF